MNYLDEISQRREGVKSALGQHTLILSFLLDLPDDAIFIVASTFWWLHSILDFIPSSNRICTFYVQQPSLYYLLRYIRWGLVDARQGPASSVYRFLCLHERLVEFRYILCTFEPQAIDFYSWH